jgi:hypothetical protein
MRKLLITTVLAMLSLSGAIALAASLVNVTH